MAISIRAMAAILGVSKSQVARDAKAGMPLTDAAAASAWRLAHHDVAHTVEGRIDRAPSAPAPSTAGASKRPAPAAESSEDVPADGGGEDEPAGEDATREYREARTRREQINAERSQLELDRLRGTLIDVGEAKRLAYTAFRAVRDSVLGVPARISAQVAAESDQMKVDHMIEAALVDALGRFDPAALLVDESDSDDASD